MIRLSNNENLLYCLYSNIPFYDNDCPFAKTQKNTLFLNLLSSYDQKFKYQALKSFLKLIPILEKNIEKPKLIPCKVCGFPSLYGICAYCKRISLIKQAPKKMNI